jgi:hypothetical protein
MMPILNLYTQKKLRKIVKDILKTDEMIDILDNITTRYVFNATMFRMLMFRCRASYLQKSCCFYLELPPWSFCLMTRHSPNMKVLFGVSHYTIGIL